MTFQRLTSKVETIWKSKLNLNGSYPRRWAVQFVLCFIVHHWLAFENWGIRGVKIRIFIIFWFKYGDTRALSSSFRNPFLLPTHSKKKPSSAVYIPINNWIGNFHVSRKNAKNFTPQRKYFFSSRIIRNRNIRIIILNWILSSLIRWIITIYAFHKVPPYKCAPPPPKKRNKKIKCN